MATEIERKYLLNSKLLIQSGLLQKSNSTRLQQAYLSRSSDLTQDNGNTVRVRTAGQQAFLTIKGPTQGISRAEFEYEIPLADAQALMLLCHGCSIEKTRYYLEYETHTWEVDEFHGTNAGLWLAEIELPSETSAFSSPPWLGTEVSSDPRYKNSALAVHPMPTASQI
jgi:adenylate cyclase